MFKLVFFVPEAEKEAVKAAVFATGAGRLGNYEHCCWECSGMGQFRPMSGANPAIGAIDHLEHVAEYRVELVFAEELLESVVEALRASHPYEEPAFDVVRLVDVSGCRMSSTRNR